MARREEKRHIVILNFEKYHNPGRSSLSSTRRADFDVEPLNWIRLQCDWYRDVDILDLPRSVRSLWPVMLGLAGRCIPHGVLFTSVQRLAKAGDLDEVEVAEALTFLWKRQRIRFSKPASDQPETSRRHGYVPTYLRTNERTAKSEKKTTKAEAEVSKIASGQSYFDEPMCSCDHGRVLHRGKSHTGECASIDCLCPKFELAREVA